MMKMTVSILKCIFYLSQWYSPHSTLIRYLIEESLKLRCVHQSQLALFKGLIFIKLYLVLHRQGVGYERICDYRLFNLINCITRIIFVREKSRRVMTDRTKLKHIVVFSFALALFAVVPMTLMYVLTNVVGTLSIQSDTLRALLTISPLASSVAGIAIAMLYVCKHPELLWIWIAERGLSMLVEELIFLLPLGVMIFGCLYVAKHPEPEEWWIPLKLLSSQEQWWHSSYSWVRFISPNDRHVRKPNKEGRWNPSA